MIQGVATASAAHLGTGLLGLLRVRGLLRDRGLDDDGRSSRGAVRAVAAKLQAPAAIHLAKDPLV